MTNAKLAAHYAALPPDEPATVVILDTDSMRATKAKFTVTNERDLEFDDYLDEEEIKAMVGQPLVRIN